MIMQMTENKSYEQIPQLAVDTNVQVVNQNYIGNAKYICDKKRICGSSNCVHITTYFLITLPTLLYSVVVYINFLF